jgi:hypothetical protein
MTTMTAILPSTVDSYHINTGDGIARYPYGASWGPRKIRVGRDSS